MQTANGSESRRHSSTTPASVSENVRLASVEETAPVGPESIVGAGGATVSAVHVREAAVEVLPAASEARTSKVWEPWARLV